MKILLCLFERPDIATFGSINAWSEFEVGDCVIMITNKNWMKTFLLMEIEIENKNEHYLVNLN